MTLSCIFTFFIALVLSCTNTIKADDHNSVAPVVNPSVPEQIHFAGQTIMIDREDLFERFDRELTAMSYTHGNTLLTIKRANRYFPEMSPILEANNIPQDILYLACIESHLDPRAYSSAKAAGVWQFIPSTAREYGLEINDYVDERYNLEKSTDAACRFLNMLYKHYGNWESVAAAYNAGMGRINKELESQHSQSAFDLYLNNETSRYIFRLLAMKMIVENPSIYGYTITESQLYQPMEYEIVEVTDSIENWALWAIEHGVNYQIIRENNPWIRAKSLPNPNGKSYFVKIPTEQSLNRAKKQYRTYNHNWIIKND